MRSTYFKRSGDTIIEDVFHFTDSRDIEKFKKQFAEDLDDCIKVDDDGDELLYVMCNYHLMCRLLNDFRDWNEFKKVEKELSNMNPPTEEKADLFFCDSLGRELKVGELVQMIDVSDLDVRDVMINDVLVVKNLIDLESNFIDFINIRTSKVVGYFGHRVLAFY